MKTVALRRIAEGELVFQEGGPITPKPMMHSVQCGEHVHVTLNGDGRFLAHSFSPNLFARIHEHAVSGGAVEASGGPAATKPVEFVALRTIEAGETLSFDYTSTEWECEAQFTDNESGREMRGFRHLPRAEKEALLSRGVLAPHILRLWLRDGGGAAGGCGGGGSGGGGTSEGEGGAAAPHAYSSPEHMSAFQRCIDLCNRVPAGPPLVPLCVAGAMVGELPAATAAMLAACCRGRVFRFGPGGRRRSSSSSSGGGGGGGEKGSALTLAPELEAAAQGERTAAVAAVTAELRASGVVTGWRGELVRVAASFDGGCSGCDGGAAGAFEVERAAYPLLGVSGYGAHVNGFVRDPSAPGGLRLWVATRSKAKQTW